MSRCPLACSRLEFFDHVPGLAVGLPERGALVVVLASVGVDGRPVDVGPQRLGALQERTTLGAHFGSSMTMPRAVRSGASSAHVHCTSPICVTKASTAPTGSA